MKAWFLRVHTVGVRWCGTVMRLLFHPGGPQCVGCHRFPFSPGALYLIAAWKQWVKFAKDLGEIRTVYSCQSLLLFQLYNPRVTMENSNNLWIKSGLISRKKFSNPNQIMVRIVFLNFKYVLWRIIRLVLNDILYFCEIISSLPKWYWPKFCWCEITLQLTSLSSASDI